MRVTTLTMALKEMKGDNFTAWLALSVASALLVVLYVPAPWFVPWWFRFASALVVCGAVLGDIALAWYLRDDIARWIDVEVEG